MIKKKKILAIIPARGGSKRIPGKNIRLLMGKPLIAYTIEAAEKSKYINRVVVSTDNTKIADVSKKWGVEIVDRPEYLAADDSKTIDVVLHALSLLEKNNYTPEICILLQPTCPLRTTGDIDAALEIFLKNKCDGVASVCEIHHSFNWSFTRDGGYLKPVFPIENFNIKSQDLPKIYTSNGAINIFYFKKIRKSKNFYPSKILPYIMSKERSIDIDEEPDFNLIENILRNEKNKN